MTSLLPRLTRLAARHRLRFQTRPYYSSYEYPLATEAPEITKTTADQAPPTTYRRYAPDPDDPFDDAGALEEQRDALRVKQHAELSTALQGSTAITPTVPASIPPNVSADELSTPTTELTVLENGVRVVSQETYGQVSTIGIVSEVGSRTERQAGVVNLLEVLAFGSTAGHSALEISQLLQDWGGTRFCNTGREQSLYCIDLLRPNIGKAMALLGEVLLRPQFLPAEVEEAKQALGFQALDMPPELLLSEALQVAAYSEDQQLGRPHFCPPPALPHLSAAAVGDYWQRQFIAHPQGLVVAGAGVRHDYLVELAQEHFGHLQQGQVDPVVQSVYRGGEDRRHFQSMDGLTRVGLALEVGGWHGDDLVTTCVLQTLLGGGNSFSAGGPGKGMYSRLYRQVLNRYGWAESAEALTAFHAESGLWGISGSAPAHKARDMIQVFAEHLARLAIEPVSDEELDRARNMLKCNVLTQLESRLVLFEDLGRQVLTYGQREDMHTTCEKIEAVSKQDIKDLALRALSQPPTLACVGNDLTHVPYHDEVAGWFR